MQKLTVVSFLSILIWLFFSSENCQDFICLIYCSILILLFAYIFCKSVDYYLQKRQFQQITNEIDNLLAQDRFLTIIKNGLQDAVDKELHADTTEKVQQSGQI